nr:MAG TPA: hypothetical protein [Caudoviricetes sp.]DAJ03518.1 MAG TPA: hypothetical protein [Bacteriophage sp.]DAK73259.1 MAG TPA: hypothetical protein [Bacteriophage sp.]DAL67586.1 MAG TPA: hypothetical protein [Bacteriophage sp.]DAM99878.1 MAG TPA: hypothetical protein [Caudoviricetes sp.]
MMIARLTANLKIQYSKVIEAVLKLPLSLYKLGRKGKIK